MVVEIFRCFSLSLCLEPAKKYSDDQSRESSLLHSTSLWQLAKTRPGGQLSTATTFSAPSFKALTQAIRLHERSHVLLLLTASFGHSFKRTAAAARCLRLKHCNKRNTNILCIHFTKKMILARTSSIQKNGRIHVSYKEISHSFHSSVLPAL